MKKPTKQNPLRARPLDNAGLQKAHGGRGIAHGYFECLDCGDTSSSGWTACPCCGALFDPDVGCGSCGYGKQLMSMTMEFS